MSKKHKIQKFILQVLIILTGADIFAQNSVIPTLTESSFSNYLRYNPENKIYTFEYVSSTEKTEYEYSLKNGDSFNGIIFKSNGFSFYPSYYGGVCVTSPDNKNYYLWSEGIKKTLIRKNKSGNTLITEWVMCKGNEFYYHYEYNITISGKTLIVNVKDKGAIKNYSIKKYGKLASFQLDRSENAVNPKIIGIPYLSTVNVLYTKNYFTTIFYDWIKTNSSQILPYDSPASYTSAFFAQEAVYNNKTNGKKNSLNETIYLTVSNNLDEVFPNIPNPVAKYKNESVNRIVYDNWDAGFSKIRNNFAQLIKSGIGNIWLIVHDWQNGGYDNKLPDVLPANQKFGGNLGLMEVSNLSKESGSLFALHENYSDFYPNAPSYKTSEVALDPSRNLIKGWKTGIAQSHLMKPSKIKNYLLPISTNVNKTLKTNSSFIDVLTAKSPSEALDYDYKTLNAGKSTASLKIICETGNLLRKIHNGPVSAEGYHHFYYTGFYDDFEAQIQTGKITSQHLTGGYYKPLLVDFDLLKMHDKTMVHGVGYYERFFYKDNYWKYMGRSSDSAMIYSATELAYGHGAFFSSLSYNPVEQGSLEYEYIYPAQTLYGNAKAIKILYNDNGILLTASQYIKKYPDTFDNFDNRDFMSQVYIEYDNGVKVYVNRSPHKEWKISIDNEMSGWYNYHSIDNYKSVLYKGQDFNGNLTLPKENGWFCYSQNSPAH